MSAPIDLEWKIEEVVDPDSIVMGQTWYAHLNGKVVGWMKRRGIQRVEVDANNPSIGHVAAHWIGARTGDRYQQAMGGWTSSTVAQAKAIFEQRYLLCLAHDVEDALAGVPDQSVGGIE